MSDRIYVATRKGLFEYCRENSGWRIQSTSFLGDPAVVVLPDPDHEGRVYAALDLGHFGPKFRVSNDSGKSWEELSAPEFPLKPEGLVDKDGMGKEVPWKVLKIWALAKGTPGTDEIWLGTVPGGLFFSKDGGKNWALNRPLWDEPMRKKWFGGGTDSPGIHSICVHPKNPKRVLVGVSCGGAWETTDAGETWTCRADGMRAAYMPESQASEPYTQDPHCIVQCPSAPDVLWTQHHNGIFKSEDGAKSWKEIKDVKPSVFGFPVAVHPKDPNIAWFVPGVKDECRIPVDGKLVVTRTKDGGKSFETIRKGLPQEHAYDIVYRHAFDVDESGERLAFGSTTGSFFVSEDGGDSWELLSNHLPPVYAIRFG